MTKTIAYVQISIELRENYRVERLDDVRIIRDRQTKKSRQFGFLRFPTIEDAEDFMHRNYPSIYLYGNDDDRHSSAEVSKVRLTFSRERRDKTYDDNDWICPNCKINNYATRLKCFRCQASKTDAVSVAKAVNVGDNDASPDNTPSQFLLVRGLEGSVSEELFAKGKGAKVASTTGDTNLGAREELEICFAEYATIEDAQAALVRYNSFDRFTIASKHVMISYIHAGVFVPKLNSTTSEERFLISPINNPSLKLAYWDEEAYVTELIVNAPGAAEPETRGPEAAKAIGTDSLKSAAKDEKARKRKLSLRLFWSNRHAELHGTKSESANGNSAAASENGETTASPPAIAPTQSFADPIRFCCYLCMRQFNSMAEATTHERVSELHGANLKNKSKVLKALGKLEKHDIPIVPFEGESEYRDRAKERRKIHGVVNKKGENVSSGKKQTGARKGTTGSDSEAATPAMSKGAALLSKMGYTPGAGLGAKGSEGMTVPISQDAYAPGVGLGAEGGKRGDAVEEAQRNTKGNGFGEWVQQGKDRARERYERLG
ncbi:putative RNA-binding protein [Cyphellophora attinorum]|uniref:Putative RNA-binding protein n=1 Tax=Cyphellophora attinorum TaxID=1664694 RepID=A0A0N0NR05_9EURO|nr:putative RNA-binding protein [Phialophora attinorum]KPI44528.1 putative RNA-binding protein [Phialophora attinorum]